MRELGTGGELHSADYVAYRQVRSALVKIWYLRLDCCRLAGIAVYKRVPLGAQKDQIRLMLLYARIKDWSTMGPQCGAV